jgi:hypothetical protein
VKRRAFLRLAGLGLIAPLRLESESPPPGWPFARLGRVASAFQNARLAPSTDAPVVAELLKDSLLPILETVQGENVYGGTDVWHRTPHGYLYSGFVQPVLDFPYNRPVRDVDDGLWGQLSVPYADPRPEPDPAAEPGSRLYFASIHRLIAADEGADGQVWYHIQEMYVDYWLPAHLIAVIPPESIAPIHPEVHSSKKQIRIELGSQTLTAFEDGEAIFQTRISSGVSGKDTPQGVFHVFDKRLSVHMVGGASAERYSLPGVPWTCFFEGNWVAIHGTYWHADYGRPRSAGCVNCSPYAARWLFRWTTPPADYNRMYTRPIDTDIPGTRVEVVW